MEILQPAHLIENSVLEIRGDGKAGGGLVLAMQSLASLLIQDKTLHVQEWPFFSSARKGAAIRSYLRVSRHPILVACEVTNPQISVLMDDGAAQFVDFAEGVPRGGTFIMNTNHTPEEVAKVYHLSGKVITIGGDDLGKKHLKVPIANISVYVALLRAIEAFSPETAKKALLHILEKRRLPESVCKANMALFDSSMEACKSGVYDYARQGDHELQRFQGYGELPKGAQTGLRISRSNKTASYARSGARVSFSDPDTKCTGCSACITNCPENIIRFEPDKKRGLLVTGADFATYCKYCRECIEVCPEELFVEKEFKDDWEAKLAI